jgi:protein ImuB
VTRAPGVNANANANGAGAHATAAATAAAAGADATAAAYPVPPAPGSAALVHAGDRHGRLYRNVSCALDRPDPSRLAERATLAEGQPKPNEDPLTRDATAPPLALVRTAANRQSVVAACARAAARGVRAGLTLAEARALCPGLEHAEHDVRRDVLGLEALGRWLTHFTPVVALYTTGTLDEDGAAAGAGPAGDLFAPVMNGGYYHRLVAFRKAPARNDGAPQRHGVFLDVTGCDRVFHGLDNLVRQVAAAMRRMRLDARLAVAPTPGAAWALTFTPPHTPPPTTTTTFTTPATPPVTLSATGTVNVNTSPGGAAECSPPRQRRGDGVAPRQPRRGERSFAAPPGLTDRGAGTPADDAMPPGDVIPRGAVATRGTFTANEAPSPRDPSNRQGSHRDDNVAESAGHPAKEDAGVTGVAANADAAAAVSTVAACAFAELHDLPRALAPLPPAVLRLEPETVAALHHLGIDTVARLAALPREALPSRFGGLLTRRLDQALGRAAEPLVPLPHFKPVRARLDFDGVVESLEVVWLALRQLVERVATDLAARGCGARRVEAVFTRAYAPPLAKTVSLSRPSRDKANLFNLLRFATEQFDTDAGFTGVRLLVPVFERLTEAQSRLHDDADADAQAELDHLVERLVARLGSESLSRPQLAESHLPERAFVRRHDALADVAPAPPPPPPPGKGPADGVAESFRPAGVRPLRLFARPQEVRVVAEPSDDCNGRPRQFARTRGRREVHRLTHAVGPERVAGEWWRGHHRTRDYYDVEDESGKRFWLFRVVRNGSRAGSCRAGLNEGGRDHRRDAETRSGREDSWPRMNTDEPRIRRVA